MLGFMRGMTTIQSFGFVLAQTAPAAVFHGPTPIPVLVLTLEHEFQLDELVLRGGVVLFGGVAQYAGFVPVPFTNVQPQPLVVSNPLFVQPAWVLCRFSAPVLPDPGALASHAGAAEVLPLETFMLKAQSAHWVPKAGPVGGKLPVVPKG